MVLSVPVLVLHLSDYSLCFVLSDTFDGIPMPSPVKNTTNSSNLTVKPQNVVASPKRGGKKEDGWKEVVRK